MPARSALRCPIRVIPTPREGFLIARAVRGRARKELSIEQEDLKFDRKELSIDRKELKFDRKVLKIDRKELKFEREDLKFDREELKIDREEHSGAWEGLRSEREEPACDRMGPALRRSPQDRDRSARFRP